MTINHPTKLHLLYAAAAAALLLTAGCKTTEANYRAAYETTIAHQNEKAADDGQGMVMAGTVKPLETEIAKGIIVPAYTAWLSPSKEADIASRDDIDKYSVVVARFRQAFNARQMRSRLQAGAYPGALIIKTGDAYFVATSTTQVPDSAAMALKAVEADSTLLLKDPYPFIFRPGHLVR